MKKSINANRTPALSTSYHLGHPRIGPGVEAGQNFDRWRPMANLHTRGYLERVSATETDMSLRYEEHFYSKSEDVFQKRRVDVGAEASLYAWSGKFSFRAIEEVHKRDTALVYSLSALVDVRSYLPAGSKVLLSKRGQNFITSNLGDPSALREGLGGEIVTEITRRARVEVMFVFRSSYAEFLRVRELELALRGFWASGSAGGKAKFEERVHQVSTELTYEVHVELNLPGFEGEAKAIRDLLIGDPSKIEAAKAAARDLVVVAAENAKSKGASLPEVVDYKLDKIESYFEKISENSTLRQHFAAVRSNVIVVDDLRSALFRWRLSAEEKFEALNVLLGPGGGLSEKEVPKAQVLRGDLRSYLQSLAAEARRLDDPTSENIETVLEGPERFCIGNVVAPGPLVQEVSWDPEADVWADGPCSGDRAKYRKRYVAKFAIRTPGAIRTITLFLRNPQYGTRIVSLYGPALRRMMAEGGHTGVLDMFVKEHDDEDSNVGGCNSTEHNVMKRKMTYSYNLLETRTRVVVHVQDFDGGVSELVASSFKCADAHMTPRSCDGN